MLKQDIIPIIVVLVFLSVVILFTKKIFKNTSSEMSRKIIHVLTGITTLTFPFIFTSYISVIIISASAIIGLSLLKNVKYAREKFGDGLFGVERKSYGDLYLALAVAILFTTYKITEASVVTYLIPILTLTFADSVAALVGVNYGKKKISSEYEDTKSIEGSFIFFVVAFMCTLIPLQLITTVGRAEVLAISFFVGILAAMIEMIGHDGNDNLLLPIQTYAIVAYNLDKTMDVLAYNFAIMLILILICMLVVRITRFSKLAVVAALLCGYMTLILGSINWLYIPLLTFIFVGIFPGANDKEKGNEFNYRIIETNTIIGSAFVWIRSVTGLTDICFVCFLVSFCCVIAMNAYTRLTVFWDKKPLFSAIFAIVKAVLVIEIPYILWNSYRGIYRVWDWAIVFISIIISVIVSKFLNKKFDYSCINIPAATANTVTMGVITSTIFILYIFAGWNGWIMLS